jgi:hypothetical protein
MPVNDARNDPRRALAAALDAYSQWLLLTFSDASIAAGSGTAYLSQVVDLNPQVCPVSSLGLLSEVLVVHAQITDLVYEHRLHILRDGGSVSLNSPAATALLERQVRAIAGLRVLCGDVQAVSSSRT